jgi:hypothetical protein
MSYTLLLWKCCCYYIIYLEYYFNRWEREPRPQSDGQINQEGSWGVQGSVIWSQGVLNTYYSVN